MCLSVTARIEDILEDKGEAIVELGKVRKKINLGLLKGELQIGDWVLVHTGFAIAKIDEDRAKEILRAYEETESAPQ